jgi:hypothetical protein
MQTSVAKLPLNLELFKSAIEWVMDLAQFQGVSYSAKGLREKALDHYYNFLVKDAKSEADIKKIITYRRRMGWLPKRPNAKKPNQKVFNLSTSRR